MENADTITNEKGWPACPASYDFFDPVTDQYKVQHHAPEAELRQHSGVCAACHAKFAKKNLAVLNGERDEAPADLNEHYQALDLKHDHAAFADGHATQVCDFQFEDVFSALDGVKPHREIEKAGVALREIWHWCFSTKSHLFAKTAAMRFAVLISGIDPATCNGATLESIASELGFSKAAASKASLLFQQKFDLKFARSRSDEGRNRMAQAQLENGRRNTRKRNRTTPATPTT